MGRCDGNIGQIRIGWIGAVPVDDPLATRLLKEPISEIGWERIQSSGMLLSKDGARAVLVGSYWVVDEVRQRDSSSPECSISARVAMVTVLVSNSPKLGEEHATQRDPSETLNPIDLHR